MTDLKAALSKLNQNLNILQEREAKYGGSTPLELLNQINDHKQAIDLTRQAITGELREIDWHEALKPLLLACRDGQVVTIQAETYIAGDQIITHIYEAPPPSLSPAEAKERHDLGILLNKVRTFWIEGVLEKSIHTIALIDLGKETQAEAVAHAWEQVLELPDQSRQTLPPGKKISHIFDEMNRALLILGSPGSGKTITLLQLARDLIMQFEQDESFTQPVPVVFNLSTWHKGQPLIEWLVTELSTKYQIPKRIGRPWLEKQRLLPLLDGLDEVKFEERAACVEAINQFGEEFGLSGLVVCSRLEEYTCLPVRLKLNGAIRLQPLTLEQVYDYLESAGSKLEALRMALQVDDSLQTLAQTPLTLGIMTLAYQNMSPEALTDQAHETLKTRHQHLLDTYIERMFQRKGQSRKYSDEQTKAWLTWLAQGMMKHNQGIFLIEQLQPSWLSNRMWTWVYVLGSRLIGGLLGGLTFGLMVAVSGIHILRLDELLMPGLGVWLLFSLVLGLSLGLIDGIRFEYRAKNVTDPPRWHQGLDMVAVGLILGLASGLFLTQFFGLFGGLTGGLLIGFLSGVLLGLRGRRQSLTYDIQTVEALSWSWEKALKIVPVGLVGGFIFGLTLVPIVELNDELATSMQRGSIAAMFGKLGFGLSLALSGALFWGLVAILFGGLNSKIVESKTIPNQGILLSVRNALLTSLGFGLILGLFGDLLFGLMFGWGNGVDIGLAFGVGFPIWGFVWFGGLDTIQHYTLRLILWSRGHTPLNYIGFLNYAAERIFLQKVGGGYIFIHRLLLEHFAAMNEMVKKV